MILKSEVVKYLNKKSPVFNKREHIPILEVRNMYRNHRLESVAQVQDLLITLDYVCGEKQIKGEIIILGGAGILLYMGINEEPFRETRDLDVNILSATNEEELRRILITEGIDIVDGIVEVPPIEDFREGENLFELNTEFVNLKVFVPSIELLACTKIFSRRQKDLLDLQNTKILDMCDKEKLLTLVDEYKHYVMNLNDPDLNFYQLMNILEKKGL